MNQKKRKTRQDIIETVTTHFPGSTLQPLARRRKGATADLAGVDIDELRKQSARWLMHTKGQTGTWPTLDPRDIDAGRGLAPEAEEHLSRVVRVARSGAGRQGKHKLVRHAVLAANTKTVLGEQG